jgi:hypothetical protein
MSGSVKCIDSDRAYIILVTIVPFRSFYSEERGEELHMRVDGHSEMVKKSPASYGT